MCMSCPIVHKPWRKSRHQTNPERLEECGRIQNKINSDAIEMSIRDLLLCQRGMKVKIERVKRQPVQCYGTVQRVIGSWQYYLSL